MGLSGSVPMKDLYHGRVNGRYPAEVTSDLGCWMVGWIVERDRSLFLVRRRHHDLCQGPNLAPMQMLHIMQGFRRLLGSEGFSLLSYITTISAPHYFKVHMSP